MGGKFGNQAFQVSLDAQEKLQSWDGICGKVTISFFFLIRMNSDICKWYCYTVGHLTLMVLSFYPSLILSKWDKFKITTLLKQPCLCNMLTEHFEDELPSVFLTCCAIKCTLYTQVNSTILKKAQFNLISCDLLALNMICTTVPIYCKIEVYPTCREF